MADALVWQLIRTNNSFLVKRGQTKRDGSVQFSSEKGNLLNVNSFKYSGIANSSTVDVSITKGGVSLSSKSGKETNKPKKASSSSVLKSNPNKARAAIKEVGVRGDMSGVAKTRFAKLNRAVKIKKGILKRPSVGKARGSR